MRLSWKSKTGEAFFFPFLSYIACTFAQRPSIVELRHCTCLNCPTVKGTLCSKSERKPTMQSQGDSVYRFKPGHTSQLALQELLCNYQQQQQGKCARGQTWVIQWKPTKACSTVWNFQWSVLEVKISDDQKSSAAATAGDENDCEKQFKIPAMNFTSAALILPVVWLTC